MSLIDELYELRNRIAATENSIVASEKELARLRVNDWQDHINMQLESFRTILLSNQETESELLFQNKNLRQQVDVAKNELELLEKKMRQIHGIDDQTDTNNNKNLQNGPTQTEKTKETKETKRIGMRTGGTKKIKIDEYIINLCNNIKNEVEEKLNINKENSYKIFEPIEALTQVVAGVNYFIKVKINDNIDNNENGYIHLRILRKLDQTICLTKVLIDKSENDPLTYF